MKLWLTSVMVATALIGCSGDTPSMRQTVQESIHVEILDHHGPPAPEPSIWGTYRLRVPDMDSKGNALVCEYEYPLFVDGQLRKRGGGTSGPQRGWENGERIGGTMKVVGGSRFALSDIVDSGNSANVKFEVVYSVHRAKAHERLFSGIEWAKKLVERPQTKP